MCHERINASRGGLKARLPARVCGFELFKKVTTARHANTNMDLEWHRREGKAPWWEFFRLRDLSEEELLDESAAIAGLQTVGRVGGTQRSPVDRYSYPPQETEVADGDLLHLPDGTDFGSVELIDPVARTLDVKKRGAQADVHPTAVFAHSVVNTGVLADALFRLAEDVVQRGMGASGALKAPRELLLRRRPRLRGDPFRANAGEPALDFAVRIAGELDETVLPIQGPPGAGKTFTAARMICELVRQGKRVGVTAVSHKVIRNLLEATMRAAPAGTDLRCAHKVTTKSTASSIQEFTDNADLLSRVQDGRVQVVGGTAWLWARPDARSVVDVLFVDEAGQMSLANVVAVSQAATSVVLLGDPQQLEQPQQGSHPEGTDVSALEHVLDGRKTIPADRGIFLPETFRLAPSICAFTSDLFYDGRLGPRPGLEHQALSGVARFEGAGLWLLPGSARRQSKRFSRRGRGRRERCLGAPCAGFAMDRREGCAARPQAFGHPSGRALQRTRRAPEREPLAVRHTRRDCRPVPGSGGANRHLLDGDLDARGSTARHGVPLQPQPAERRHLPRALRLHLGGKRAPLRA